MTDFVSFPVTLQALFEQSITRHSDNQAFAYADGTCYTYREVGEFVHRLQFYLSRHGLIPGDKIALISENKPQWGISYFAITTMGCVAVPVLVDFSPVEINTVLQHAEVKALFVSEKVYSRIKDKVTLPKLVILADTFQVVPSGEDALADALMEPAAFDAWKPAKTKPDDIASLVYTSGTTGRSKGVILTNDNLVWDAVQCLTIHPVSADDIYLSVLPLAHTYECTLGLILGTMQGAMTYYLDKAPTAPVLLDAFKKVKPTILLTVPLIIEKLYRAGVKSTFTRNSFLRHIYRQKPIRVLLHRLAGRKMKQVFGGRLTFLGIGGAALSPEVECFLREGRLPYSCGYGMTETSPMICGSPVFKTKFRSVGPPMPGIECRIDASSSGNKREGELLVRGRNVMKGYYKDPEATALVLSRDGWLKTGDLAVMDNRGRITLKGRKKSLILGASGENIYPEEIEAVINEMDHVIESAVFLRKGKLIASVYLNQEAFIKRYHEMVQSALNYQEDIKKRMENYLRDMKVRINETVSKHARIHEIELREKPFEKTATQKIKRYLLQ